MRTAFRTALLFALVATMMTPAAPSLAGSDDCSAAWARTYNVRVRSDADSYRVGELVTLKGRVTRKESGLPVADAEVAAGTIIDDWFAGKMGTSDAAGRFKLSMTVKRQGIAELRAMAHTDVAGTDQACAEVDEYGFKRVRNAFVVKR